MTGDATTMAGAIRAGHLSAVDAMQAALSAAEAWQDLGAIVSQDADRAISRARAFDRLPPDAPARRAPFAGMPTLVKDLGGPFAGFAVRAGSRMIDVTPTDPAPGGQPSDQAQRFDDAGLIAFGLTTSPEFGLSLACEPAVGPAARNPLDRARSPGGSSGGAAAAVAAGIVALAHATDAGGSIRVPAACCGLVGLKPGRGRVAQGPGFGNLLGGIASELAVCRSVRDCASILAAVSGRARGPCPPSQTVPSPTGPLRIGVVAATGTLWPTDTARQAAVMAAADTLAGDGYVITPIPFDDLQPLVQTCAKLFGDIVSVNLAELVQRLDLPPTLAEPMTQAVIRRGRALTGTEVWALHAEIARISHAMWRLFETVDLLVTPMLTTAPRPVGWLPMDDDDTTAHFDSMTGFAPLAALANIAGLPALTLPMSRDGDGLPLPVQLLAPMGAEAVLLAIAARLETVSTWRHPHPVAGMV